jgi:putative inorganic carbon (HCO3(-)) transporter
LSRIITKSIVYVVAVLFILLHGFLLLREGIQYLIFLPLLLLALFIAFVRLDNFLLLIVFLVPLSIPLYSFFSDLDVNLFLPSEPLIIIAFLIFLIKIIKSERIDYKIFKHPVSIAIYINLAWILITALTSSMPVVSIKFFLSRFWFLVVFYFLTAELCKNYNFIKKYLWAYIIPLIIVIFYTIIRHTSIGLFDQDAAHYVMGPFFNDHTSYGAILAMVIPVIAGFTIDRTSRQGIRFLSLIILTIYIVAFILSFSRAAWVSLIFAGGIFIIVVLRIRLWMVMLITLVVFYLAFSNLTEIVFRMGRNTQDSSARLAEHLQSISNITNDYSNVERLNRWNCAMRMFGERPLFGWGPGTYMFKYAPYQISYQKTPISTEEGDRGNAHSEYLGPLSESGFIGSLSFLAIVIMTLITGFSVYRKVKTKHMKILVLSLILGLITYFAHGIMNNFLDTDKASALFWGFTAMLVAVDISYESVKTGNENKD